MIERRFVKKLQKAGNSKAVIIPSYILQLWKFMKKKEIEQVEMEIKSDGTLIIKPL